MTRKQALCQYLLAGGKISIMNGYRHFGISNISREIRRLIEQPFNVTLTRKKMEGKTKYGTYCTWFEYTLTHNRLNAKGIKAIKEELSSQSVRKSNQLKNKVVKMKDKV